jgi:hypothetical protein
MDTIVPETHIVAPDTFMIGKPDQRRTLKGEKGMMPPSMTNENIWNNRNPKSAAWPAFFWAGFTENAARAQ